MGAFAGSMTFGTGGLRQVLGMDPARMNAYTVARVTQGLAQAILQGSAPKTCAIAYDTRKCSDVFARRAAEVLMGNGIEVVLWPRPVPTPLLSYTIRTLRLGWDIVIPAQAEAIMRQIESVEFFVNPALPLQEGRARGLLAETDGSATWTSCTLCCRAQN